MSAIWNGGRVHLSLTEQARLRDLQRMPYDEYLQTPEWVAVSAAARERAGMRCQGCNLGSAGLNVHHRTYERRGHEDLNDLTVLCAACHRAVHLVKDLRDSIERMTEC